jgi:hypothetical protein
MSIKIKRPARIAIGCAAVVLCAAVITCATPLHTLFGKTPFLSAKASKQSDYPVLPVPAQADTVNLSLNTQVSASSLVVDATVVNVLDETTEKYTPESGTFEANVNKKLDKTYSEFKERPVVLKINDTLKGTPSSQTITMYIGPFALDCSPAFKTGDRLVFMLAYGSGEYYATTLQQSYFYISDDNKIYPAVPTDKLKGYSGDNVDDFKQEIKSDAAKKNG